MDIACITMWVGESSLLEALLGIIIYNLDKALEETVLLVNDGFSFGGCAGSCCDTQ